MSEPTISSSTRHLGLFSHLVFWAFVAEWFLSLTGAWTHHAVLALFTGWVLVRTVWYQRMRVEGATGVSSSEAVAAFVFAACAVALLLIPLGVPLGGAALALKVCCALTAAYVIGRGVARGISESRRAIAESSLPDE